MSSTAETVLNLRDFNVTAASLPLDAAMEDPTALALPHTAKLRLNATAIEQSINGGPWEALVAGSALPGGEVRASDIGISVTNTASQNSDAIEAWFAGRAAYTSATLIFDATDSIGGEFYDFARTIAVSQPTTFCSGGPASSRSYGAYVRFPANTTGFHLMSFTGSGRGDGSRIEDLTIVGLGFSGASSGYGIQMSGHCEIRHCSVINFGSHGIYIDGAIGDGTNANYWRIENTSSGSNKGCGLYITGSDSNAGTAISLDVSTNLLEGIYDNSFLGNTFIGCHADSNGFLGGIATYAPYRCGDTNARSMFLGCYVEGGQLIPLLSPSNSAWIGGLVEGQWTGGGSFVMRDGYIDSRLNVRAAGNNGYSLNSAVSLGSLNNEAYQAYIRYSHIYGGQLIDQFDNTLRKWQNLGASETTAADSVAGYGAITAVDVPRTIYAGTRQFDAAVGFFNASQRIDFSSTAPTSTASTFYKTWFAGDIRFRNAAAGESPGWVCTGYGTNGSYSGGRTATGNGTVYLKLSGTDATLRAGDKITVGGGGAIRIVKTCDLVSGNANGGGFIGYTDGNSVSAVGTTTQLLSGSNSQLVVGMYLDIGGTKVRVTAVSGTSLTTDVSVPAGNGSLINPTSGVNQGTAGAGTTTTVMVKPTAVENWTADELIKKVLVITSGGGSGQVRGITANTATTLTVAAITGMDNTSVFELRDGLALTFDPAMIQVSDPIGAASGMAITFSAPTFAELPPIAGNAADSTGTPGAATQNTNTGRVAIAAGAASVTVTNSKCTTTSRVFAVLQTSDGTLTQILRVVPGSGSFVITGNANATGNCNVAWEIG